MSTNAEKEAASATLTAHQPEARRELGYTRQVCSVCGTNLPCPDRAQAISILNDTEQ